MLAPDHGIQNSGSRGERSKAWLRITQWLAFARGERGSSLVEMALVVPILLSVVMGIIAFGIAFNNYIELTNAAGSGVQVLAVQRGNAQDICTVTSQAVTSAAPNLKPASLNFTINIYAPPTGSTTPCTGTAALSGSGAGVFSCGTAGSNSAISTGGCAQVTVTYPLSLVVYGHNFAPTGSVLTAETTEAIQ